MPGGVGGVASRDVPLSRSLTHRVISCARNNQVAFRSKLTSKSRQDRLTQSRMTHFGHPALRVWDERNPNSQRGAKTVSV